MLKSIFEDLVRSYNPNYQDMAVRAAAMGYMEIYHGGKTPPAEGSGTGEKETNEEAVEEKAEDSAGEEKEVEIKDEELEELEKVDLMGLLVGWEDGSSTGSEGLRREDVLREFHLFRQSHVAPELLPSESFTSDSKSLLGFRISKLWPR